MRTLADFKRAMTVGSIWLRKHVNEADYVKRTVSRVCSGHLYVVDETGKEIRLDFPKADEFQINENGEAEIYWPPIYSYDGVEEVPRRLVLTYRRGY